MSKLLIYIGENKKFDVGQTISAISSIDGVANAKTGSFIGSIFECEYVKDGQSTIVRISPEAETVTVESLDNCALDFAIQFQQRIPVELHAIDMDYSFNVSLKKFATASEFRREIES